MPSLVVTASSAVQKKKKEEKKEEEEDEEEKEEWYTVIKAHECNVFEILQHFVLYCVSLLSLHIESTVLLDSL